jgi:hypothetical protein
LSAPGLARASAISSCIVFAGDSADTVIISAPMPSRVTGAMSRKGSNGTFDWIATLVVNDVEWIIRL